jgi:peptidoglycan hydrolase CwlO-like protein
MNSILLVAMGAMGSLVIIGIVVGTILVFNIMRRLRSLEDENQSIMQSIDYEVRERDREIERIDAKIEKIGG